MGIAFYTDWQDASAVTFSRKRWFLNNLAVLLCPRGALGQPSDSRGLRWKWQPARSEPRLPGASHSSTSPLATINWPENSTSLPAPGRRRRSHTWDRPGPTLPRKAACRAYTLELVAQLCLTLCTPWTVAYQASLSMVFSRQSGIGSYSLLQGIFLTQGLNPGQLHCRQILYHLSHQGSLILANQ